MKHKQVIAIIVLFSTVFSFQSLAVAQIACLRQKAFGERKEKSLAEALQSFGIRIVKNRLDFTDVPDNVDWIMDEIRAPEKGPIVRTLKEMPIAKLIYPIKDIEQLPPISRQGTSSAGVYIGLVEWQGRPCPAAIKLFNEYNPLKKWEVEVAQVCSYLGINPRFYGVVQNEKGSIIGYAMQLAIAESMAGWEVGTYFADSEKSEEYDQITDRLYEVGLTPTGECLITRTDRVISIDAGGVMVLYDDKARDQYENFVRQMNESSMPRLQQPAASAYKATLDAI